jgi:hypothetical protein
MYICLCLSGFYNLILCRSSRAAAAAVVVDSSSSKVRLPAPFQQNFWEIGERRSMTGKGARTNLHKLDEDIKSGMSYNGVCETHFEAALKYYKFIEERIQARASKRELS